jgi:hypothetical protein
VKKVSDQRTNQLLDHYVNFEKIGEERISWHQIGKGSHYLTELSLIIELLVKCEALFPLQDYEVFAHHESISESSMDAIVVRNVIKYERLLEVDHEQVEVLLRNKTTRVNHIHWQADPFFLASCQVSEKLSYPASMLLHICVMEEMS